MSVLAAQAVEVAATETGAPVVTPRVWRDLPYPSAGAEPRAEPKLKAKRIGQERGQTDGKRKQLSAEALKAVKSRNQAGRFPSVAAFIHTTNPI